MKSIESLEKKFSLFSRRERFSVLLLCLCAIVMGAYHLFIAPSFNSVSKVSSKKIELEASTQAAQKSIHDLKRGSSPEIWDIKIASANSELNETLVPLVNSSMKRLLAPEQVGPFLRSVMPEGKESTVRLVTLKTGNGIAEPSAPGIFRYPVTIEFNGRYLDLASQMRAVQASNWHLLIDSMEINTDPKISGRVSLVMKVSAFGTQPNWLATPSASKKEGQ